MSTKTAKRPASRRAYVFAVTGLAVFLVGLAFWRRPPIVFDVQAAVAYQQNAANQNTDSALALSKFERELCAPNRVAAAAKALGLYAKDGVPPHVKRIASGLQVEATPNAKSPITLFNVGVETTDPGMAAELIQTTVETLVSETGTPQLTSPEDSVVAKQRVAQARETALRTQQALEQYLLEKISSDSIQGQDENEGMPDGLSDAPAVDPVPVDSEDIDVNTDWTAEDTSGTVVNSYATGQETSTIPVFHQNGLSNTADPEASETTSSTDIYSNTTNSEPPSEVTSSELPQDSGPSSDDGQFGLPAPEELVDLESEPSLSDVESETTRRESGEHEQAEQPAASDVESERTSEGVDDRLPADDFVDTQSPVVGENGYPEGDVDEQPGGEAAESVRSDDESDVDLPVIDASPYYEMYDEEDCEADFSLRPPLQPLQAIVASVSYEPSNEQLQAAESPLIPNELELDRFDHPDPTLSGDAKYQSLHEENERAQLELSAAVEAERELLSSALTTTPKVWISEPAAVVRQRGASIDVTQLFALLGLAILVGCGFACLYDPDALRLLCTTGEVARAAAVPVVATLGRHRIPTAAATKNRQLFVRGAVIGAELVVLSTLVVMGYFVVKENSFGRRTARNPISAYTEAVGRVADQADFVP